MKIGIVIYSNDPETVWNAIRFGSHAIKHSGDQVRVFLLGRGAEAESLDTEAFKVADQIRQFVAAGGAILACGNCLKIRQAEGSDMCPISTMNDLYQIVVESDKVLTF